MTRFNTKKYLQPVLYVAMMMLFAGCAAAPPAKPQKKTTATLVSQVPVSRTDNAFYLYMESQFRKKNRDIEGALHYLKQAIQKDPHSAYLKRELVQLYWQKKDAANALTVVSELIKENPDDVDSLVLYARITHMLKKMEEAKAAYEKVLALAPEHKGIYLILGGIYADEGKSDAALQIYRKLVAAFPDYFAGYFVLGQTYAARGNFDKAEAAFLRALELEPQLDDARYELINLYKTYVEDDVVVTIKPGDTVTGICQKLYKGYDETIRKAIVAANPQINNVDELQVGQQVVFPRLSLKDDSGRHIGDKFRIIRYYKEILGRYPNDPRAAMGLGYFYHEMGDFSKAEKLLKPLGRRSPEDASVMDVLVRYYLDEKDYDAVVVILEYMAMGTSEHNEINYLMALAYYGKGDKEKALGHLLKISPESKFFDKSGEHIYYLYTEAGKTDEAEAFLKQAIAKKPETSEFRLFLGKLYEDRKAYSEAEVLLRKGIELDPENPKLHFLLGVILDKSGNKDEAIAMMKTVIRISPKDATALNYLGYTYADLGIHLEEAEALVKKALLFKPKDGYITDSLGWIYYQKGDYEKAVEVLNRAMELVSDDPTVLEHLGDAYLKIQERQKALEMYQRSLENSEGDARGIKQKIQDLRNDIP